MKTELSSTEARLIALTAQGFSSLPRKEVIKMNNLSKAINRLGLIQIDSVNVLTRAHYLPIFSRHGLYDCALLDRLSAETPKKIFEYWGHEASLLPVDCHPLLRWRMARAQRGQGVWRRLEPYAAERNDEAAALLLRIEQEGPLAASDISNTKRAKGMWIWSDAKHALEYLFWAGLISSTHRRGTFERVYDLTDRVLPHEILQIPTPSDVDALRALLARSAQALGIATAHDLRDYYRLSPSDAQLPIQQLVEDGTIIPVRVYGWQQQAYLHKDARISRKIVEAALISPFDPLIWYRPRTERLFDFHYRLEIYTPAHKRKYGYYVLPFLLDGRLVARVDLKADRKSGTLIVKQTHFENDAPHDTHERLTLELQKMAVWLKLSAVTTT